MQKQVAGKHRLDDFPPELREALLLALQLAATRHKAPSRCRKQVCRGKGRCHAVMAADGEPDCAALPSRAAQEEAIAMLCFVSLLGRGGW